MAHNNGIDYDELLAEQFDSTGQYKMVSKSKITLIDSKSRSGLTCVKCGTNLSVKYKRVLNGKTECYCNMCVLFI